MVNRRRQTVKRPQKKRRIPQVSRGLLVIATAFAVGLILVGAGLGLRAMLNNPENLPISQVDIQGELKFIKDEDLRNIISKYTQTNLYLLDVDTLKTDLELQPWVRSVGLRKAWPSQLIVTIEEQRPVAFWGRERLMNQYGELFAGELSSMQGIFPVLESPEENGREMGERFIQIRQWLEGLPLEIAELTEDGSGSWRIKIRGGPEILVGNADQERRIKRFRVGYERELATKMNNIRKLDLRYTNGFAVEWKQSPVGSLDRTSGSRRS